MINYTFLFIGLIYGLFLPGFIITEAFFPKFVAWKKIPLYMLFSVIISTLFSYLSAYIFGFNKLTFLGCFLFFIILLLCLVFKKKINLSFNFKDSLLAVLTGTGVYLVYFLALFPAIFKFYNGYFVMGGPNWQDTAMHLSIIQSLNQGNFPPQAPYFAGHSLSYYYFSDLHAAIISTFVNGFFPRILVLLNPFFAALFFFSVFALSFEITKRKIFSLTTSLFTVFYGNLGFVNLVKELVKDKENFVSLISSNAFNFDKNYIQMTPVADYLLQNRPMMFGLPAFVTVIFLLINKEGKTHKSALMILFAGIITAVLIKFQLFGFVVCWIFFITHWIINRNSFKEIVIFSFPTTLFAIPLIFSKTGERSILNVFLDTFSWGQWQTHTFGWFLCFVLTNLGVAYIVYILIFFLIKIRDNAAVLALYISSVLIMLTPFVVKFTIYDLDMLKFFYYLIPIICVIVGFFLSNLKTSKTSYLMLLFIATVSSLSSFNMLIHSYLNKNEGYSYSDYKAGIWILNNTPQKSIFVTLPTVHNPASDIGGRLRITSYINWPHSHGFNVGDDNVFTRVKDVESVYKVGDTNKMKIKYHADYVFYGKNERNQFPAANNLFDNSNNLRLIYNQEDTKIYEIL